MTYLLSLPLSELPFLPFCHRLLLLLLLMLYYFFISYLFFWIVLIKNVSFYPSDMYLWIPPNLSLDSVIFFTIYKHWIYPNLSIHFSIASGFCFLFTNAYSITSLQIYLLLNLFTFYPSLIHLGIILVSTIKKKPRFIFSK